MAEVKIRQGSGRNETKILLDGQEVAAGKEIVLSDNAAIDDGGDIVLDRSDETFYDPEGSPYTIPIPEDKTLLHYKLQAAGGGGGAGRAGAADSERFGGGGGGGGGLTVGTVPVAALLEFGTELSLTVGAGGAGGDSVTENSTSGDNG